MAIAFVLAFLYCPAALSQVTGDGYLKESLSGGFIYEFKAGPNRGSPVGNAPGFSVNFTHRPRRWFALEAGLELIPRPIGNNACCEYATNGNDELYLVPIGARYVWEPQGSRLHLSFGAGGAYMNHAISVIGYEPVSGWLGQFVASGNYQIKHSNKFRIGLTVRYYYGSPTLHFYRGLDSTVSAHLVTIGPDFIFSF